MAVILEDQFAGDGTMEGRVPDTVQPGSATWDNRDPSYSTSGGRAVGDSNADMVAIDIGVTDFQMEAVAQGRITAFMFRKQVGSGPLPHFEMECAQNQSKITIWEVNPGFVNRGEVSVSYGSTTDYKYLLTVQGTSVTCRNDDLDVEVTYDSMDALLTETDFGFRNKSVPEHSVEYVTITDFAAGTDVQLDWTDTSGNEDGFRIRRSAGATEPADWDVVPELDTVGPDVTTYRDLAVPDGDYYYNVRAFNTAGESTDVGTNIESITLPATGILLRDTFTNVPDTPLASHSPEVGGVWSENVGAWFVRGTVLEQTSDDSEASIEVGAIHHEYVCNARATVANGFLGFSPRYSQTGEYILAQVNDTLTRFYTKFGGSFTDRGNLPHGGIDITIEREYRGVWATNNDFTWYIDGNLQGTVALPYFVSATRVGFRGVTANGNITQYNDITVTELP